MNKIIPLYIFVIVCIIDFLGIYFEESSVVFIAKPLLMITLFWYYFVNTKKLNKLFAAGLFFSLLGDVLLLGTGELYFIFGLLFFLIAHVFYILMVFRLLKKTQISQILIASIPYLLIFIALLNVLYSGLGEMKIPVVVYALTISFFGMSSLILFLQNKTKTTFLLVLGVLIFITSDAVLAINMFYEKQTFYPLLIMLTYVMAQFLICKFVLINSIKK